MNTEKMTIHKALAELKVIDSRINNAISAATLVTANKHSNDKIGGKSISDYKSDMKAAYQKVTDLINRRNAMKRAVVLSNAQTTIQIGADTYTVAEAIEMKNHGMEHMRILLNQMTRQLNQAQATLITNSGEQIEKKAEQYVLSVISSQPKDGKMSIDSKAMQSLREQYIENNTYDLIDPNEVTAKITEISEYITQFETEIDAALSVSNALTVIEFSY